LKKKLLYITPELPYPPRSGGKVKSLKLLESLASRYDVTLASPLKGEDPVYLAEFEARSPCRRQLHSEVNVPRTAGNLLKSYCAGHPLNVTRTLDRELQRRVCAEANDYEIVFLDHYEVYSYLPDNYRGTVVYHAHNAYFKIWDRFATLPGNPLFRLAAWLEGRRVRRYESQVAKRADLVFSAPNDAAELIATGVEPRQIFDTYHLGDDSQLALPPLSFSNSREKLVYVGFLGWEPNAQGLLWFIESVWPALKARYPSLVMDIAGKGADERLQASVAQHPDIRLLGFVADLESVYCDSRVSVAPLLFGSGMKVKVLDAMARGLPIVTTEVGAEGIAIENGKHMMVAENAAAMVEAVSRLLSEPALWQLLQEESRTLISQRYTWSSMFATMHEQLDRACTGRPQGTDHNSGSVLS